MAMLSLSAYTILLVDDVAFARETLSRGLLAMGRPSVIEAENGWRALDILRSNKVIDFVISDFNMPFFNGLQLLKAVRTGEAAVHRGLPFAMLTGFSDKHLVDSALALDVNAFLLKPASRKTLSDRLTKMLNRGEEDPWLKSADLYGSVAIEEAPGEAPPPLEMANQRPSHSAMPESPPSSGVSELDPMQLFNRAGVMRRLSSLSGKFEDSDLADEIGVCVERLIGDNGGKAASRIVSYIDGLVKREVLKVDHLPKLLADAGLHAAPAASAATGPAADDPAERAYAVPDLKEGELFFPLSDVPPGAILTRNIHTEDGSLFMTWGTQLTPQVVAIIDHLDRMGVLALTKIEPWVAGIYVSSRHRRGGATLRPTPRLRAQTSPTPQTVVSDASRPAALPEGVSERRVTPRSAPIGSIVTRDIFTADGRLYLHAGAQLSQRMISILNDLDELGHMKSELWIRR